ncbi:carbohydrate-binding protein, partial [Aspergillus flavus]
WGGWESLGGVATSPVSAVSWASNSIDLFVKGTDNALWQRWWDGTNRGVWESLGGVVTSDVKVASWGKDHLDVFVRGSKNDAWHISWHNGKWGQWGRLGDKTLFSAISAVCWGVGRLDLFAVATDKNALLHQAWDGKAWRGWESCGGILLSQLRNV